MKMKIIKTLCSIAILTVVSSNSFAAGTEADTSINNRASISYNVGGTPQSDINSSPTGNSDPALCTGALPASGATPPGALLCATTFEVDKKVDLLVTGGASEVEVVPGELGATGTGGTAADTIITYTLKNEGNSTESFTLTPSDALALTTGDEFNTSNCRVQSITGGAASPAPTTGTTGTVSLPNEGIATITVECDIPPSSATVVDGAKSIVDLLAEVSGVTASTGADSATGVEVVFADDDGTGTDTGGETGSPTVTGERNGKHSATNTYLIATAGVSVQKVSSVVYDPSNGTSDPKRIPGAIIKYDITVTNTGGTAASDIVITDVLDSNVLYRDSVTTGVPNDCESSAGVSFTCSETPSGTMTSSAFTLPATTGTATMTFYVEIQ